MVNLGQSICVPGTLHITGFYIKAMSSFHLGTCILVAFEITICLLYLIQGSQISGSGVKTSDIFQRTEGCPLTCHCMKFFSAKRWKVHCDKFWTTIPPLPENTTFLSMENVNISILRNGSFTKEEGKTLIILTLKNDNISHIEVGALQNLNKLQQLHLIGNKLTTLKTGTFLNMANLLQLNLENNLFKTIPNSALSGLISLERLSFQINSITNCTFGLEFQNLTNLTNINLRRNPLHSLSNNTFSNLGQSMHLNTLTVSESKLRVIEAGAFLPLKFLKSLQLDSNPLNASMLEHAFYGLRLAYNLSYLNLDATNLTNLGSNTYRYLVNTSLASLEAKSTSLKIIQQGTFQYLPRLKTLKLDGNYINLLQKNAFQKGNIIEMLDLSKNRLPAIPDANEMNLQTLKWLSLKRNAIAGTIQDFSLNGYSQLKMLNLHGNSIRNIAPKAFLHTPSLTSLVMSENKIAYLRQDVLEGLKELETLDFRQNRIFSLDVLIFSYTPSLKKLDLSNNNHLNGSVKQNIAYLFKPLRSLTRLQLTDTGLQELPDSTFHNLTELSILSLSSNQLSKWSPSLFRDQSKLEILSFSNNKLSTISKASLEHLNSLKRLDVSHNTFTCDCELLWFVNWIRSRTVHLENLNFVTCKSPPQRNGHKLVDLYMEKECMSFTFYYIFWSILFFNIFSIILLTVTYRLRWYIK